MKFCLLSRLHLVYKISQEAVMRYVQEKRITKEKIFQTYEIYYGIPVKLVFIIVL